MNDGCKSNIQPYGIWIILDYSMLRGIVKRSNSV